MDTFSELVTQGNIGYYLSCSVVEIFLFNKKTKEPTILFTRIVFQEQDLTNPDPRYLGDRIPINSEFFVGIRSYELNIPSSLTTFELLKETGIWRMRDETDIKIGKLIEIEKQFVPSSLHRARLNCLLDINPHGGSYVLEFFDRRKLLPFQINAPENLEILGRVSQAIFKEISTINLCLAKDRIGNILFQFPVTILDLSTHNMADWKGAKLSFAWHPNVQVRPTCDIVMTSKVDGDYMGSACEHYNGSNEQEIVSGNLDINNTALIFRRSPDLLLGAFDCNCPRITGLTASFRNDHRRKFLLDGSWVEVDVSDPAIGLEGADYLTHIGTAVYAAERESVERDFSFRQYLPGNEAEALLYVQELIKRQGLNGIYLWDPFLRSKDILRTLYFSQYRNKELRAIGAVNKNTRAFYNIKGGSINDILLQESGILNNPSHNNFGLKLEFRLQHDTYGFGFHDRFLIFPGSISERPKVYSLGISVNGLGSSHHIIQEVPHPQRIIDSFNSLWSDLNSPDCLVWKSQ
jgi:hypothetical protein